MLFPSLRLRRAARDRFGWQKLRPIQLKAMRALLKKHDALVVLPTGGGKSAIYQVPATLLPGPTIVISPLLALQQDQLTNLNERGLRAVRISSAETPAKQAAALKELREGTAKFLFITPEQLSAPERLAEVKALKPSLVAVDEAHCISSWGYDFRPDYLAIGHLIKGLGRPPVVALTATASPPVREDITARLGLRHPRVFVSGLDRPNLFVEAQHCPTEEHRWRRLLALLKEPDPQFQGCGIVYVPTRRTAEELAERLVAAGFPAQAYHGGMAAGPRRQRHEDFLSGKVPIMVATSAFGMGIDKPDIRWVAHVALPDSPDSYLQEIGRAGRDGAPARALLLYRAEDMALQRFFNGGAPELTELRSIAGTLHRGPLSKTALGKETGIGTRKLATHLSLLESVGAVVTGPKGELSVPRFAPLPDAAAREALAEHASHQSGQRSRTDMMRRFAESRGCRMQPLLGYFGEQLSRPCGHCDNCHGGLAEVLPEGGPYPLHSTVRHAEWGPGTVLGYEKDRMTVLFEGVGYRTLSVTVVQAQNLLVVERA